ncbi:MAG: hypothetical protein ACLFT4_05510 [Bacteroidales bacterium]
MGKITNHKLYILNVARQVHKENPGDKPAIRQAINDAVDAIVKSSDLIGTETENVLVEYAIKLHPKK